MRIKIKKWGEYQHYKDRNPTWVKLHRSLLTSKDWVMLDNDGRALLVALMMIACSHDDALIPFNEEYICRVAYFKSVNIKPLIELGFIEIVSNDTDCYQNVPNDIDSVSVSVSVSVSESKEDVKKSKTEYSDGFLRFWQNFPKQRIGSKPGAWKSWVKTLQRGEIDEEGLISACLVYSQSDDVERGYASGCQVWLNDEKWRNDYSNKNKGVKNGKPKHSDIMRAGAEANLRKDGDEFGYAGGDGRSDPGGAFLAIENQTRA